ncbi:MAG: phosphoenolpyruvate carboxykinase (GTP) [Micrococcaceae bacterium]
MESIKSFVHEIAELTKPENIQFINGSDKEYQELVDLMIKNGTVSKVEDPQFPDSYLAQSDPSDVARVEDRTFICTETEKAAGPTNNWVDPQEMHQTLDKLFAGCMAGRTMYVIPFVMGRLNSPHAKYGVQVTDSPYVVASMRIMTKVGADVQDVIEKDNITFTKCVHSVGMPLEGKQDVPWPCNAEKYIVQFPEDNEIYSYGSNYGGNALLGKKCFALRIASYLAQQEGWLAEHMLILKLTSPENKEYYIAAAFPSACGKTNLAMLESTIPGWKVETIGDDIAWLYQDDEGYLRAVNPEAGMFGVAPGTSKETNPQCLAALEAGGTIFTNVAQTKDGKLWWEGLSEKTPENLLNWKGEEFDGEGKAAHPNSRFCTPLEKLPSLSNDFYDGEGVRLSAILFGGRRKTTIPLVAQATDWEHGVFFGSVLSSETTAAAAGQVGVVRRDPMAMLPFLGYNLGDYLQHWLSFGKDENKRKHLPSIFNVNWFRRDEDGSFLWPGFGDNIRVLQWITERLEGKVGAQKTNWGLVPYPQDIDVSGLNLSEDSLNKALKVSDKDFAEESQNIKQWYDEMDVIPSELQDKVEALS